MKQLCRRFSRKHRFFLDASLTLLLLLAVVAVVGIPAAGDEARFRREEKANLAGPSEILDLFPVPEEWAGVRYDRLLIADAGEEILFYPIYENGYGTLCRREKTDGLLLVPAPTTYMGMGSVTVLPLFLFADEPAAVKAEVQLRLSDNVIIDLSQVRGADAAEERDEYTRERFYWFNVPMPKNRWSEKYDLLSLLWETNAFRSTAAGEYPATIRLYDADGKLLETKEYVIRSRAMDAQGRTVPDAA